MKNKIRSVERPKTCIIYVRVSSEDQVRGYSLVNQEKDCREYARKNGWEVLELFREEGESAKNADRTELQKLLKYCSGNVGKIGHLIVYKLDRFARKKEDHFAITHILKHCKIELKSVTEMIENTTIGRLFEGILASIAEFDNDVRSERAVGGMKAKALDGYWPMGAPWGYNNVEDESKNKIIVPHPENASIVEFCFKEYARGTLTYTEIAKKVNAMGGVRSKHGRKISKQFVNNILKNPIHYGWVEIPKFGISVQGRHEAIISKELYFQVQLLKEGGKSRKQPRNRNNPDFPLRGLKCGGCGGNLTGGRTKGRSKMYDYYSCMNFSCPLRRAIAKKDMEDDFTRFLESITPDSNVLDAVGEVIIIAHEKDNKESLSLAERIEKRIEKLQEERDALLQLMLERKITNEDYSRKSEKQQAEQRELEIQRSALISPEESVSSAVKFGINLVKEFPHCWPTLEPGELRVLISLFFPQNVKFQYPEFKTVELAPIFTLTSASGDAKTHQVRPLGLEPRTAEV